MSKSTEAKKPFPWRCTNCKEKAVRAAIVDYATQMEHDGRAYAVRIDSLKTPKCDHCGHVMLDAEALHVLDAALRVQANLLTPEQIRDYRVQAGLSEQELAAALGVAEAAVKRWESGAQIPPRALDNLLRLFFGLAQVREILTTQQIGTLPPAKAAS